MTSHFFKWISWFNWSWHAVQGSPWYPTFSHKLPNELGEPNHRPTDMILIIYTIPKLINCK
jgi:hypothetical protein